MGAVAECTEDHQQGETHDHGGRGERAPPGVPHDVPCRKPAEDRPPLSHCSPNTPAGGTRLARAAGYVAPSKAVTNSATALDAAMPGTYWTRSSGRTSAPARLNPPCSQPRLGGAGCHQTITGNATTAPTTKLIAARTTASYTTSRTMSVARTPSAARRANSCRRSNVAISIVFATPNTATANTTTRTNQLVASVRRA